MPKRTRINKNPKVRKTQRRGRKQRSSRKQGGGGSWKNFARSLERAQELYAEGKVPFVYLNKSTGWVTPDQYPMMMSQSSIGQDKYGNLIHIFYEQKEYDSDYDSD